MPLTRRALTLFVRHPGPPRSIGLSRPRSLTRCLLAVTLLTLLGCAGLTQPWLEPEVSLTSLRPRQITLEEQSFLIGLRIRNPNDRTLPIKAMTYALSLEGTQIAAGGGTLDRQIPAFGEEEVEVSVTGSASTLAALLPRLLLQAQPAQYRIAGTVTVAGVVPIPYHYSGEIDPDTLLRAASPLLRTR
ncbi:LEA type 2 family protein [Thiocapsa imhoffii]|nr:LEA type 2 family protein [Thiocapsa imhoffii]